MSSKMKKRSTFDKVMIIIIFALIGIITIGTIIGVVFKNPEENKTVNLTSDTKPVEKQIESLNKKLDDKVAAYTGLGTIRAVTLPGKNEDFGAAVVITPWFSYPEGDTQFYEELSRKRVLLINIFTSYFSSRTLEELNKLGEEIVKDDLLTALNEELSLGQISKLYFTDYIFLN